MRILIHQKDFEVSELNLEVGKLSSLAEMRALVHEVADFAAPSDNWKDRVQAAARAIGLEWERAKSFYYKTARRVDSGEMDNARAAVKRLRIANERREAARHVEWLRRTVEHLREDGGQFDSESLDVLERLAGVVGAGGGAVVAMAEGVNGASE